MHDFIARIFVYGTLKRGQVRGRMWPREPLSIEPAIVQGELYDLGPYPALLLPRPGCAGEPVAGEVWSFAPADLPEVLRVLDKIECYNQPGEPNMYLRAVVDFTAEQGCPGQAYTYLYADRVSLLAQAKRVPPDARGQCVWPSDPSIARPQDDPEEYEFILPKARRASEAMLLHIELKKENGVWKLKDVD